MLTFTDKDIADYYLHDKGVVIVIDNPMPYTADSTVVLTREELQKLIDYIDVGIQE